MSAQRNKQLAKIHLAKKQLAMDDDSYRAMLHTVAQVGSAADLDERGRKKVLQHLTSKGASFKPKKKRYGQRPHNYDRLPEYITKVEALLTDMGLSWAYADSIARNITGGRGYQHGGQGYNNPDPGVERLAWVKEERDWRAIVAALHVEQQKRGLHATINRLLDNLGLTESHIQALLKERGLAGKNWHRRIKLMESLIDYLVAQGAEQ